MIIAKPLGGLGNQMFAYAAAYSLAKHRSSVLKIDTSNFIGYKSWPYQLDVMSVPGEVINSSGTGIFLKNRFARFGFTRRHGIAVYREPTFHFDAAFFELKAPVELNGYFQSWRYFEGAEAELRKIFHLKSEISGPAKMIEEEIRSTPVSVSIHVRRGDYLKTGAIEVHGALTLEYYRRAISMIMAKTHSPKFFLFSDDPDWVAKELLQNLKATVVRGQDSRPWEDMHLMASCQHHVIANSSFSWWGAWLNPNPSKIVIAPRSWFSSEVLRLNNICDLHPEGWILL